MKIQSAHPLSNTQATEFKTILNSGFIDDTLSSYTLRVLDGIHHAEVFFSKNAVPENIEVLRSIIAEKTYLLTL
jgi:hypothetical protein